jgi:hypothetical protein
MRMGYLVYPHADLGGAALRQLCLGRGYEVLARDLADECICRSRRQAEPGRILQEFPSRQLAVDELLFQRANTRMFSLFGHVKCLPMPCMGDHCSPLAMPRAVMSCACDLPAA